MSAILIFTAFRSEVARRFFFPEPERLVGDGVSEQVSAQGGGGGGGAGAGGQNSDRSGADNSILVKCGRDSDAERKPGGPDCEASRR